ncbi:reticulocyte-binding protein PFD0110w-like isoform X2 [Aricia agestis]|uniref:reticulocyte-binding protein PFD0110w-like isoform X2 n=1 Tax=Aricia agestis TaxID=91739 RepID=UPI001C2039D1|nr:reticulocyte-binding protein PFD0110w-like isoform X2 [Aricia agestis]
MIIFILFLALYVVSNETVHLAPRCKATLSKTNLINSGEISEANGYKVLHDFNFPDVTYPTTTLESCQPFYFNSNGIDAIVGPFSSDVQSNYRSLLSTNENKIKDVTTKKSIVDDNIKYQTPFSNVTIYKTKNESDNVNVLDTVRKLFEKYIAKNYIDSELKEILSILFGDNVNQSKSSEIIIIEPVQLLDEIIGSNVTTNKSSEENVTEQLFDRFSEPKYVMNSVIEELIQLLDKNLADNNLLTYNSVEDNVTEIILHEFVTNNRSDNNIIMQLLSDEDISYNASSENIQLELELTKEDIKYILLNSTNDMNNLPIGIEHSMDVNSISQNIEIEQINSTDDTIVVLESILLPETAFNDQNIRNSVLNEHLAQSEIIQDQLNSSQTSQSENVYEHDNDTINLTNFTSDENSVDSINTDQISFNIPKEPVVFDVVYRDVYNIEKPVLDIVPSSIPVRLKINIEIVKQDSNEIDNFYRPDFNIEQFAPRISENHMGLQNNVKHSVENTEEDSAPEEQITVLDEINESDFINALSILLLDSLNNNPLEIIPPEFINDENCSCSSLLAEDSSHFGNNSLNSNITLKNYKEKEEIQPILAPESYIDNNTEHRSLETEMNQVTYNTSPIIEMLRSVINSDQLEDDKKYNNTDFKSKNFL